MRIKWKRFGNDHFSWLGKWWVCQSGVCDMKLFNMNVGLFYDHVISAHPFNYFPIQSKWRKRRRERKKGDGGTERSKGKRRKKGKQKEKESSLCFPIITYLPINRSIGTAEKKTTQHSSIHTQVHNTQNGYHIFTHTLQDTLCNFT